MAKRANPYEAQRQLALKKRKYSQAQVLAGQAFRFPRPFIRAANYPAKSSIGRQETKFVDIPTAATTFNNANGPVILNPVQQGVDYYQRLGNKIKPRSLHIKGFISSILTSIQGLARMVVVLDKAPSGAAALPAITNILQERDQAGAATNGITSALNIDNRNRFKILRDKWFNLPSHTLTVAVVTNPSNFDQELCMKFNEYIRLDNIPECQYVGTANPITIANINTNAIYVIFTCQAGINNMWQAVWSSRFKFTEH